MDCLWEFCFHKGFLDSICDKSIRGFLSSDVCYLLSSVDRFVCPSKILDDVDFILLLDSTDGDHYRLCRDNRVLEFVY